jgi:uncharacterized membrane protein YdjX (TVP38/TMEM64 family)
MCVQTIPESRTSGCRGALLKLLVLVLILGGGLVLFRFTPARDLVSVERLGELMRRLGALWWLPAAYVAAFALGTVLLVPASAFILAAGAVFGPLWGAVWSWVGGLLGALAAYAVGRILGLEMVERLLRGRAQDWMRRLQRGGFWPVLSLRLLLLPFGLLNYFCGAAGIRVVDYALGTALGILPSFLFLAVFGGSLLAVLAGGQAGLDPRALLLFAGSTGAIVVLGAGTRKLRERAAGRDEA